MINSIRLRKEIAETLISMAEAASPKEVVALLSGKLVKDELVIEDVYYQPFHSDEVSAYITFDVPPNLNVVGTFHSHPGSNYRPSAADKRLFAHYGSVHFIICEPYSEKTIHCFDSEGKELSFLLR